MFADHLDASQQFFDRLARAPIDVKAYRAEVERLLEVDKLVPAQRAAVLEQSLDGKRDPVEFLRELRLLAARNISEDAFEMLVRRTMSEKPIDLGWLRSNTRVTDVELEYLGRANNVPWNVFKKLSTHEQFATPKARDTAHKIANYSISGVAGEMVAERTPLKDGFKIRGKTMESHSPTTDYELVDAQGNVAELEVKAWRFETWAKHLSDIKTAIHPSLQKLVNQIRSGHAAGHRVYLAVPDSLESTALRNKLLRFLKSQQAKPDGLVFMSQHDIRATASQLREHLGVPSFEASEVSEP